MGKKSTFRMIDLSVRGRRPLRRDYGTANAGPNGKPRIGLPSIGCPSIGSPSSRLQRRFLETVSETEEALKDVADKD